MTSRFALGLIVLACLSTTRTLASPPAQAGSAKTPPTDAAMIASAMSAAPSAVSKDATIVAMNDKMEMRTLRAGTNGWTCMPDTPNTPGPDPMCVDKNGMDWVMALAPQRLPVPPRERFARLDVLKFQGIIRPGMQVRLDLDWQADKLVLAFRLSSAAGPHASGRIVFRSEHG